MAFTSILSILVVASCVLYLVLGRSSNPKPQPPAVKVALVTGCTSGFGRGIALRLASDGFHVVLNDLPDKVSELASLRAEIAKKNSLINTTIAMADVSDEAEVETMIKKVVEELGSLDVMIANAGVGGEDLVTKTTKEQLNRIYSTNATGVFYCYKHAAKQMIAQGWGGKILGASSVYGKQGQAAAAIYCASKFAVRGLTQAGAAEWGRYGITVNAYAPGLVDTPALNAVLTGAIRDAIFEKERSLTPTGRLGTVDDTVNLVSFLTSNASDYITGQCIGIDGGRFMD